MKKFVSILIAAVLMLSLFACTNETNSDETTTQTDTTMLKIGIVQHVDHPSLNEIRETIIDELSKNGYDDTKAEVIYKNANGDASLLGPIFNNMIADNVDIIVPIATPTAQSVASLTSEIPIVFSAVSNPIEAGLVEAFDKTDKNITGVSNSIPIEQIFDLALDVTPDVKTFGFIYNPGEINSSTGIERAKAYCDANGLTYKEATIASTADIQQSVASIVNSVDAFFTPNDNMVASAMTTYVQLATDANKPIYCGADSMVKDGGFATVGIDYTVLGKQTAEMVIRILNGAEISETPVEAISDFAKMINVATADTLGFELSDEIKSEFVLIGEE